MLIRCPECGRKVSEQARQCPECGHPIAGTEATKKATKPTGCATFLALILGGTVVATWIGVKLGGDDGADPATPPTASAESPAPSPPSPPVGLTPCFPCEHGECFCDDQLRLRRFLPDWDGNGRTDDVYVYAYDDRGRLLFGGNDQELDGTIDLWNARVYSDDGLEIGTVNWGMGDSRCVYSPPCEAVTNARGRLDCRSFAACDEDERRRLGVPRAAWRVVRDFDPNAYPEQLRELERLARGEWP